MVEKETQTMLDWLSSQNIHYEFIHHAKGETTKKASEALGVGASEILKCLLFKGQTGGFAGVIVTGDKRVSLKKLREITGKNFRLASAQDVLLQTGYKIGGIPPFAFSLSGISTYVDFGVTQRQWVYASAGSELTGIKFSPNSLRKVGYNIVDVSEVIENV